MLGEFYIENVTTACTVYRDRAPFMDRELQNECIITKKNDTSRLKALYQNLQVGNLQKLAKNEAGMFI